MPATVRKESESRSEGLTSRVVKTIESAKEPLTLPQLTQKAHASSQQSEVAAVVWRMVDAGKAVFTEDKRIKATD